MNIGKAIKTCRVQKGYSQEKLADLAGISVSYLSLLERGKRDPNITTVETIASALNIPFSILAFLASEKEELSSINNELIEKLSYTVLNLIKETNNG